MTRNAYIATVIGIIIAAIFIGRSIWAGINYASNLSGINVILIGLLIVVGVIYVIYYLSTCPDGNLTGNLWTVFWLVIAQGIFLFIYYGKFYEYVIGKYGLDPRLLLLVMTALFFIVIAIIYFGSIHVLGAPARTWIAHVLFSVIGALLIAGWMFVQPFVLFDHNPDKENVTVTDGKNVAKGKFWVLKDENGKIVDISWSSGYSTKYGKQLVQGTPEDARAAMEFLGNKSSSKFLYGHVPFSMNGTYRKGDVDSTKNLERAARLLITVEDLSSNTAFEQEYCLRVHLKDRTWADLKAGNTPYDAIKGEAIAYEALKDCKVSIREL
jgi:hypothetical protein